MAQRSQGVPVRKSAPWGEPHPHCICSTLHTFVTVFAQQTLYSCAHLMVAAAVCAASKQEMTGDHLAGSQRLRASFLTGFWANMGMHLMLPCQKALPAGQAAVWRWQLLLVLQTLALGWII